MRRHLRGIGNEAGLRATEGFVEGFGFAEQRGLTKIFLHGGLFAFGKWR
jgi:hypothetical protein